MCFQGGCCSRDVSFREARQYTYLHSFPGAHLPVSIIFHQLSLMISHRAELLHSSVKQKQHVIMVWIKQCTQELKSYGDFQLSWWRETKGAPSSVVSVTKPGTSVNPPTCHNVTGITVWLCKVSSWQNVPIFNNLWTHQLSWSFTVI